MSNVLLTVSGVVAADVEEQVARRRFARVPIILSWRAPSTPIIDYAEARRSSGWFGQLSVLAAPI